MKNQADKLISEKLSSLDSLPDGYSPNLDSKWSIIQQSAKKKSVIPFKVWIGIAACLLIAFFSTVLLQQYHKPASIVVEIPKETPKIESKSTIKIIPTPELNYLTDSKTLSHQKIKSNNESPAVVVTEKDIQPEAVNEITVVQDVADENTALETKTKQRYVEVDFDAPNQVQTTAENNFKQQLTVKLGFTKDNYSSINSSGNKTLRIHQNF